MHTNILIHDDPSEFATLPSHSTFAIDNGLHFEPVEVHIPTVMISDNTNLKMRLLEVLVGERDIDVAEEREKNIKLYATVRDQSTSLSIISTNLSGAIKEKEKVNRDIDNLKKGHGVLVASINPDDTKTSLLSRIWDNCTMTTCTIGTIMVIGTGRYCGWW